MLRENTKNSPTPTGTSPFSVKALIIGGLSGFLNGLFGSGGGSLFVPATEKFMNSEEKKSHATALAFILPLTLISAFIYSPHTQIPPKMLLPLILGGLFGGVVGADVLNRISGRVIHIVFGVFMVLAAFFVLKRSFSPELSTTYAQETFSRLSPSLVLWIIFTGFFSGLLSGMGIGGGTILVPALLIFFSLNQRQSQGINLIFFIPTALLAIFRHSKNGNIDLCLIKPTLPWGLLGAVLGSSLALRTKNSSLGILFTVFLALMGVREILMGKKTKKGHRSG